VTTSIATGALRPKAAVVLSAILNLVGAFLSVEVALTVTNAVINIPEENGAPNPGLTANHGYAETGFRWGQIGSASLVSRAHYTYDAQKTMAMVGRRPDSPLPRCFLTQGRAMVGAGPTAVGWAPQRL
jgi:phosphate/sulfate permease